MQQDNGVVTKEATAKAAETEPRQPASPLDGRLARWPLFPYLLCSAIISSFLIPNVQVVPPPQFLPLLSGILLGCLVLHVLLYFGFRRRSALASLGLFGILFAFFGEHLVRQIATQLPGASWRVPLGPLSMSLAKALSLGICALAPFVGGWLGYILRPRQWRAVCLCMNLIFLGFSLTSAVSLMNGWRRSLSVAAMIGKDYQVQDAHGITTDQ
jgi:hypothetical protein